MYIIKVYNTWITKNISKINVKILTINVGFKMSAAAKQKTLEKKKIGKKEFNQNHPKMKDNQGKAKLGRTGANWKTGLQITNQPCMHAQPKTAKNAAKEHPKSNRCNPAKNM